MINVNKDNLGILKSDFICLAKSLFDRGYATGGAGNMSALIDENLVLTTPTGSSFGRLKSDELSIVTMDGEHVSGLKPSKEVKFHLEIYKNNPKSKAVVHLHSTYLTALSCLENLNVENTIKAFTPYYVMRIGQLPLIPYYNPGDDAISTSVARLASKNRAFLLANHGPIVSGTDIFDAVDNMEELEETAKLYFLIKNEEVKFISEKDIAILKNKAP